LYRCRCNRCGCCGTTGVPYGAAGYLGTMLIAGYVAQITTAMMGRGDVVEACDVATKAAKAAGEAGKEAAGLARTYTTGKHSEEEALQNQNQVARKRKTVAGKTRSPPQRRCAGWVVRRSSAASVGFESRRRPGELPAPP